jgi:phage terminase small subunit
MPHSRDSLVLLPGGRRPLEPPPELKDGTAERALFVQVAASVPDGHFAPEDVGLLAEYARTATLARYASEELLANPVIGTTVNPWLGTHSKAVRQMMMLATRLRLGPRSRSQNTRKGKPVSAPSWYDLNPVSTPKDRGSSW